MNLEDAAKVTAKALVDFYSATANMYGCEPCPKCSSKFRASFHRSGIHTRLTVCVECDECGFEQEAEFTEEEQQERVYE